MQYGVELGVCMSRVGMQQATDTKRLEHLWSGEFGVRYTDRNRQVNAETGNFHHSLCTQLGARRVLEVGCNIGLNLTKMAAESHFDVWGVDLNGYAIAGAKRCLPNARFALASAYSLPFGDDAFDLTFTSGVLIHIPPHSLERVMTEIHRTSRKWICCCEYYSAEVIEVPYRGEKGALYKSDFGRLFFECFPGLKLVEKGFLAKETTGFDNLTFWIFEKG